MPAKTPEAKAKVTKNLSNDNVWGMTEKGKRALRKSNHMNRLKHGMYAAIPILCKKKECPYTDVCYLDIEERPKGEKCPVEASTIEKLVDDYCQDLEVSKDDAIELSMVRNLIDIDISILRCNKKLAVDADIVKNVVVAVTENDTPITKPEIAKAYELQNRLVYQRNQLLRELNSTPKAKADSESNNIEDASTIVAMMKANLAKSMEASGGDEVKVEVVEE